MALRWTHSEAQLAGMMTKPSNVAARPYELLRHRGTWRLVFDREFTSAKKRRIAGLNVLDEIATYHGIPPDVQEAPTPERSEDLKKPIILEPMRTSEGYACT